MPSGPLTIASRGFVVSGSSSAGSSPVHSVERPAGLEMRQDLPQDLGLLAHRGIARLRHLLDPLEPLRDVVACRRRAARASSVSMSLSGSPPGEKPSARRGARRPGAGRRGARARCRERPARGPPPASPSSRRRARRAAPSRSSAIVAMPTFDLSVCDAYAVISAPALVSALKSVVLPALGSPTMPTSSATAARVVKPAPKPPPCGLRRVRPRRATAHGARRDGERSGGMQRRDTAPAAGHARPAPDPARRPAGRSRA